VKTRRNLFIFAILGGVVVRLLPLITFGGEIYKRVSEYNSGPKTSSPSWVDPAKEPGSLYGLDDLLEELEEDER